MNTTTDYKYSLHYIEEQIRNARIAIDEVDRETHYLKNESIISICRDISEKIYKLNLAIDKQFKGE